MSRIGSGDGNLKPEDEITNHFRTSLETKESIEKADEKAMTITSGKSEGFISKKLGNKEL
jgi:hypothetical protein